MINPQCYSMTAIAGHRVFDAVGLGRSSLNAKQRIISYSALIHAIKSQLVVVAAPEKAFADTKFVAMHTLTINNAVATILGDLDFARSRGRQVF